VRILGLLCSLLFAGILTACGSEGTGRPVGDERADVGGAQRGEPVGQGKSDTGEGVAETSGGPESPPSSRHAEYVMYATAAGDSVRAFLVYPERNDDAPAIILIHEIFGLTDWIRSVADRYAAEGFIVIAPDLLWGRGPGGAGTDAYSDQDAVIAAIRELSPEVVKVRLDGARDYLNSLSSFSGRVGTVGFCWGGHQSFQYAAEQPGLNAAVVFYGSGPEPLDRVSAIQAPVLGLYGGDDNRINTSIPSIEKAMKAAGKRYEKEIYPGAGHGFLRDDEEGANASAAKQAWPRSVSFLHYTLDEVVD
jgi:carboxymethylenebutenolidase